MAKKDIPAKAFAGFTLHSRYGSLRVTMQDDGEIQFYDENNDVFILVPAEGLSRLKRGITSLQEIA